MEVIFAIIPLMLAMFVIGVIVGMTRAIPGTCPVCESALAPMVTKHQHRYDHMEGDGLWRCGICNEPKPKGS